MKRYIITIFIILLIILLCGCSSSTDDNSELKNKVTEEISYLDENIIYILNELNNISFENYSVTSEKVNSGETSQSTTETSGGDQTSSNQNGGSSNQTSNQSGGSSSNQTSQGQNIIITEMQPNTILIASSEDINWDLIKNQIEVLNSAWSTIILDLYSFNIDGTQILNFSSALDNAIISIKNENKNDSLKNLALLYSYIPKYAQMISLESSAQNIKQTKYYILNAYSQVYSSNWNEVTTNIDEALTYFKNIVNDIEYSKNNEYKVNKTYVLIEELKNSLASQDKEIFYINYKNAMESINTL